MRDSSHPTFWEVRYEREDHLFGTEPSAFVRAQAHRIPSGASVVEVGAGEARTLVWCAREHDHRVTAVDFAANALANARHLAARHDVDLETIEADVRTWRPERRWDAAVVTFLHLLPDERVDVYALLRRIVRPGGWILGEWFRPDHLDGSYARMGPSAPDRMVSVHELRDAFASDDVVTCDAVDATLNEGAFLNGRAALARLVVRRAA